MPDNDWKRVNQTPEVSAVVKCCNGQGVPRVEIRGRESRFLLTPSAAERLAGRLMASAQKAFDSVEKMRRDGELR